MPKPEFKLLRPKQVHREPEVNFTHREPNIRKRTATIEKPISLSKNLPDADLTVKKTSGLYPF